MRNSDDSPGSRHREHYYQSKSKRKDQDSDEDMNEEEKYRQEDLRTKLNELKKSKDHHRERQSSLDKDHNKHRNSRQLQVHDYDTSYHKSNQNKRDRDPSSRDPYYSSYQQKGAHYYQQEHRSYTSDRHSSDKRSSKAVSSTTEKYVEIDNKDKPKRSKMIIEAEVNEIVSEEEISDESSNEEESKSNKKSKSPESKKDLKEDDSSDREELELNENIQAEIELRNKLKRRIQQEAGASHAEEDDKKEANKKVKKETDSGSQSAESTPRSCSTRSNPSDTDPDTRDASQSTKSNRSVSTNNQTPEHASGSESEKDEIDEKLEEYYKKMAAKKRLVKPSSEEIKQIEVEKKEEEEKPSEPMTPPLPVQAPEIIMHYCASQGCRSVEEFECLNKIEEGAYGVVYRAKDKRSGEMVALKRLKMEKEKEGFPITSIREIDTLLKAQHPNVVTVREIVVGFDIDRIFMVMDYVEHDLKSLMQYSMKKPFMMSEVKTLMIQLLRGVAHLHDNWIIHRDLKTSNLLLSHKGVLKIADFGLAREYGSPLKEYTAVVVTLWYRCPELLLGAKKYSTSVDIWSVGCIFGELMLMKALFNGKNENDQLNKIFKDLGTPSEKIWPGFKELPLVSKLNFQSYPYNTLRSRFGNYLSDKGFELITKLLTYDPNRRITAEEALKHEFFKETPLPIDPSMFPTWPAKSEGLAKNKIPKDSEPRAPSPAKTYEKLLKEDEGFVLQFPTYTTGFTLR